MKLIKKTTRIDFLGMRKQAIFISTLLNLAIIVGIAVFGFNFGVDFAGGTVVEVKFNQNISPTEVRKRLGELSAESSVQRIGGEDENSFLIRLGGMTQLTAASTEKAAAALKGLGTVQTVNPDVNNGLINLRAAQQMDPQSIRTAVEQSGTGVKEVRSLGPAQGGGFDYQVVASGMADRINAVLSEGREAPDYTVQRVEYVGPQVGKQLRNRGLLAVLYAAIAILIYVAFRFDFRFGPGALVAMIHDVIMVCGYYLVTRREFNLTSIAVLLTIIGYSVNDTIVIYDRIREDMVRFKGKTMAEIINIAVNETLGRTLVTSLLTSLSLVGLLIFGVGEIFDFAAAMLVGMVVGVYSTIYIASPMTLWLDERAAAKERAAGINTPRPA